MVRLTDVRVPLLSRALVAGVLETGRLAQGKYVAHLERLAASTFDRQVLAVNSGTTALMLALVTAGVRPGDRVIIPAMTFAGTANAVAAVGGIPVCVDIGEDRLIDLQQVAVAAEKWDTRHVMPVHLYGHTADVFTLRAAGFNVIEDAAQSVGQPIHHGGISLYGSKVVGCGEGGLYVSTSTEWARIYSDQGQDGRYNHVMAGQNFRLTDLQAAVALGVFFELPKILKLRQANAVRLYELLSDLDGLPNPFGSSWYQFVVEVDHRDQIRELMAEDRIETAVHYPVALPDIPWIPDADTPRARRFAQRCLSIPVHEHLTGTDLEEIAGSLLKAVEYCAV